MNQGLRIFLPIQWTWVWSLVREDCTRYEAAKPVCRNCWNYGPQVLKPTHPAALVLQQEKPLQWEEAYAPQVENIPCLLPLKKSLHTALEKKKKSQLFILKSFFFFLKVKGNIGKYCAGCAIATPFDVFEAVSLPMATSAWYILTRACTSAKD